MKFSNADCFCEQSLDDTIQDAPGPEIDQKDIKHIEHQAEITQAPTSRLYIL